MIDYTAFYGMIGNVFTQTTVFNISWIFNVILTGVTLPIITRDENAYGYLLLPVSITFHILGVTPSFLWYILASIIFVLKIFSIDVIGNLVVSQVKKGYTETGYAQERKGFMEAVYKKRIDKHRAKKWNEQELGELYDAVMKGRGKL